MDNSEPRAEMGDDRHRKKKKEEKEKVADWVLLSLGRGHGSDGVVVAAVRSVSVDRGDRLLSLLLSLPMLLVYFLFFSSGMAAICVSSRCTTGDAGSRATPSATSCLAAASKSSRNSCAEIFCQSE